MITDQDRIARLRGVLQSLSGLHRWDAPSVCRMAEQAIASDDALERQQAAETKQREAAA